LRDQGLVDENGDLLLYGQPPLNPNPPTVAEMMEVALPILDSDPDGFMLVLEEEATDNFGNNNNAAGVIEAALRADEAIGLALDFVDNVDPNTLVLTAADSDAGGLEVDDTPIGEGTFGLTEPESDFTIRTQAETQAFGTGADGTLVELDDVDGSNNGNFEPFVTGAPDADGDVFDFGVAWASLTDVNGAIVSKAYGLNSEDLPATADNTDMYRLMYQTLFGASPEEVAATRLRGTDDSDELVGTDADETLAGLGGNDLVAGGLGSDVIEGGDGDDVLRGDNNSRSPGGDIGGDDIIFGGAGSDRIGGKGGNDMLYGGEDDDMLWGDDGDDVLYGGLGNDMLTGDDFSGGQGTDTFVLAIGEGTDTITDFEVGTDLIGLAGGLTFGSLALTTQGNDTLITAGDETLATVLGVSSLSESAFVTV
ncbi:MAG: alkaline phosphatase, partial [Cyanobacteria bacterium J06648_10]